MHRVFARFKELIVYFIEAAMVVGSIFLAAGLRFDFDSLGFQQFLWLRSFIFASIIQLGLYFASFYDFSERSGLTRLLRKVLVGLVLASTMLWALYYLLPEVAIGRGIYGIALAILIPGLLLWRLLLQHLLGARLFRNTLVVMGTGPLARECAQVIREMRPMGLELKGFLASSVGGPGEDELGAGILGGYDEVLDVIGRHHVDTVVVAVEERRGNLPMMDLLECRFTGVEVVDGLTFYEGHTQKVYVRQMNPSWLVFNKGFNISPLVLAGKRALDIVLSGFGLLVTLPILLLAALLIKLSSRGPVFYTQVRVGLNGRPFTIIKLRSMKEPGSHGDDGRASAARDPVTWNPETARITKVGSWLRRLHLDELPQLINVLRGDMSLVGPRPERPEYIARLEQAIPFYRERHIVRPGVTGLAQVMYDYGASIEGSLEKLQYDLSYIRNLSIIGDIIIMLRTVQMLLLGREERP